MKYGKKGGYPPFFVYYHGTAIDTDEHLAVFCLY